MAICSKEGVEAMLTLTGILGDVFEDGYFPRGVDGEFASVSESEFFDSDNRSHLRTLFQRLDHFLSRDSHTCGDLRRVVFGYHTLVYANNRLVDLENDALALHPRFERLETIARETLEYLRDVSPLLGACMEQADKGVHAVIGRLAAALDFYDGKDKAPEVGVCDACMKEGPIGAVIESAPVSGACLCVECVAEARREGSEVAK